MTDDSASGLSVGRGPEAGPLEARQLALLSNAVFDVPPRTRLVLAVMGAIGVGLIAMESLVSGRPESVALDKVIHFLGYGALGFVFVLALRPTVFIPSLLLLTAMGVAIEFLQRKTGRSFDTRDMMANFLGITVGGFSGVVIRSIWAYVRREWKTAEAQRRLVMFPAHATIMREGDPIDEFFVIKSGRVRLSRSANGENQDLATAGPGAVVGVIAVIQATPLYATVVAEEQTVLYRMSLKELMDSAGGREQPVSLVLTNMADIIRQLADRHTEMVSQRPREAEGRTQTGGPTDDAGVCPDAMLVLKNGVTDVTRAQGQPRDVVGTENAAEGGKSGGAETTGR